MQRIGPYRIIRTIALGGMGEVFLATLERSGGFEKRVALKCVLPRLMADPRFVELFEREARLAAALSHRHIVQIFDFGQAAGRSWLAMEYVHGVDLKAVLDGLGPEPLPLGLAIDIGIACARGLDYAHRARDPRGRPLHLVHRDVSPQNVLLSFEGDVKLADFGLAQAVARDPHEGGLQGKFAYMSPEQVAGRPLDGRSDQFALGVVLYEMVSGRRAFFADDGVEQILDRVRRGAPLLPLAEAAPALPAPVRRVIERTLQVERTDRFSDAGALAEALADAAAASDLRLGELPLGRWLRERFPERSRPPLPAVEPTAAAARPVTVPEVTAVAGQPIAPVPEHTVDAAAPVGLRVDPLAATPSGIGPHEGDDVSSAGEAGDELSARSARQTALLAVPPDDPPAPGPAAADAEPPPDRRPLWLLVLLTLAVGVGLWWSSAPIGPDPALVDDLGSAVADAAPVVSARDAAPDVALAVDAAPDAAPDRAIDAAPDARPVDARAVRPDARPARARPIRPPRTDAGPRRPPDAAAPAPMRPAAPDAAPRRPPDAAAPAPMRPAAPDAAPPDAARPPAARGARVRLFSPGARVTGPASPDGWWTVPPTGLLLRVVDGPGPPVVLRVKARGGRFEAAVDARPWGQVLLGDRDLGPTPAAAVPLEVGRQTLRVVGPDREETVVRIEAARD